MQEFHHLFEMSQIFIHIGLHRTGTTFLQKHVFPKIEGIAYYGRYNPYHVQNYVLAVDVKANDKILISDEGLTTYPYFNYPETTVFIVTERLKKLFPHAKIIVVFRDKKEWKKSLYDVYVRMAKGNLSRSEWEQKIFNSKNFEFGEFKQFLKTIFDDVLVLWYKDFKKNPQVFVEQICNFMGVSTPNFDNIYENQSFNKNSNRLLIWVDKREMIPDICKDFIRKGLNLIQ